MAIMGGATQSSIYKFGYCEVLLDVGPGSFSDIPRLFFFLDTAPVNDEGATWFSWRSNVLLAWADMRGGTAPQGRQPTFSFFVPYGNPSGSAPDSVRFWVFNAYSGEKIGIITSGVRNSVPYGHLFTWSGGGVTQVAEVAYYLFHSVSSDGASVAIFSGTPSSPTRVIVIDLFGEKEKPLLNNATKANRRDDYSGSGFTVIRERQFDSSVPTACFIPNRVDGVMPETNIDRGVAADPATDMTVPAFGSLHWPRDGHGSVTIYKMVINGVEGSVGKSIDPCFGSRIVIDDPSNPPATDHFVTSWGPTGQGVDLYEGYIRGAFTGVHPAMQFAGEGLGQISIVTLPTTISPVFTFDPVEGNWKLTVERHAGEIAYGGCVDGDGRLIPGCTNEEEVTGDPCTTKTTKKYAVGTALSACGQDGSASLLAETIIENYQGMSNTLAGGQLINDGQVGQIIGGKPPFAAGYSGGSVGISDDGTFTITFSTCGSGAVAGGTLTVTDDCGNEITATYRHNIPGASWVFVSNEREDETDCTRCYTPELGPCHPDQIFYPCGGADAITSCTTYSGTYRYDNISTRYTCQFGCVPYSNGSNPCDLSMTGYDAIYTNKAVYQWKCP
jgi:hypothetical protein